MGLIEFRVDKDAVMAVTVDKPVDSLSIGTWREIVWNLKERKRSLNAEKKNRRRLRTQERKTIV